MVWVELKESGGTGRKYAENRSKNRPQKVASGTAR